MTRKTARPAPIATGITVMRRAMAQEKRDLMRQGVILRAQTIPNKRKVADKRACRKGTRWD